MPVVRLDQIKDRPVSNIPTKYSWVNGMFNGGLPECAVHTLAGESGVGKSRLLLDLCVGWSRDNQRIYYCPNEVYPEQFKQWAVKFPIIQERLLCAENAERDIEVQVRDIYDLRPDIAIIDSVSMNKGFRGKCLEHMDVFKRCASECACHLILIAHMNAKGAVKGAGEAVYNADIVSRMHRCHGVDNSMFYWIVQKTRFGPSGEASVFRHLKTGGIEIMTSTVDPRAREMLSNELGRQVSQSEVWGLLNQ